MSSAASADVSGTVPVISLADIQVHNKQDDCWVIINQKVYDLTDFLHEHPGGSGVILEHAGGDATEAFSMIHSSDILSILPAHCLLGTCVDVVPKTERKQQDLSNKPSIDAMLNVFDFEEVAKQNMSSLGWGYYSSGADDEITMRENHLAFHRIFLRPRVLVNVADVDCSTTVLGKPSSFPLFICATALGKLAHPDGELNLTRAAASHGIIQMVPTLSSFSLGEIVAAKSDTQTLWFQLYVNGNRDVTANMIKRAEQLGCAAICVTVDAPGLGNREKDQRQKFDSSLPSAMKESKPNKAGAAATLTTFIDPSLCWEDISWLQSLSSLPIIIKGIQCGEDALLAVQHGVKAIIVSNHGGRQLDSARSSVEVLKEVMDALRCHKMDEKVEVYVDGGIRRGTDIFKCLALGARAVGIGRPVLYGMAAFGQEGVEKVLKIFKDELETTMRMMGTPSLSAINQNMILTRNLTDHIAPVPKDNLANQVYSKIRLAGKL